jgi:hypothetical protein
MCPDTVQHDDSRSLFGGGIGGHPARPAWFGETCNLVASLLGLQLPPNHAVPWSAPSTW